MINVKDVGAKGDGQTDDTQAIQAAINDIPVEGVSLFFPAGTYILSAPILVQGKSIGLIGEGRALTRLNWNSNTNGIHFIGSGFDPVTLTTFLIQQMTLSTSVPATQGTALIMEWLDTPFNPLSKARIHEVEIRGTNFDPAQNIPPATWWHAGILIRNSGGLDMSHVNILGNVFQSGTALRCETVGSNVFRHFLSNVSGSKLVCGC